MLSKNRVKSTSLLFSIGLLSACMDASTVQLADQGAGGAGSSDRSVARRDLSPRPDQYEPVELNGFAEACARPGDCESGLCFAPDINAPGLCTVACDQLGGVCPDERWICQLVPSLSYVCVPAEPLPPCAPCEENWECGGEEDLCLPFLNEGGARFCAEACAADGSCPLGSRCEEALGQCIPIDEQCSAFEDPDRDGIGSGRDNCPEVSNSDQADLDGDGVGDICDLCPRLPSGEELDSDGDGLGDGCDLCPELADPEQRDRDEDRVGDACDNCPADFNEDQLDSDEDGVGDRCEERPPPPTGYRLLGTPVGGGGASAGASYQLHGLISGAHPYGSPRGVNSALSTFPTP